MKITGIVLSVLLLLAVGTVKSARAQMASVDQGLDAVEVMQANATVEKIDLEKRKVTLLFDDGKHKTYKVDKSVQNLDQVKVGDRLNISFTEEIIILVGKSNRSPSAAEGGAVGVAAQGAKPAVYMVDTSALSAKILAVDAAKHRVTVLDPDGKKKTVKLGKQASNLDQLKVGETVDMVMTESLLVEIVK